LDWRASVYGSRTGNSGGFGLGSGVDDDSFDATDDPDGGLTFGASKPAVPEAVLRQRGGKSFYRAYEIISAGRMHNLTCTPGEDGTLLEAAVDPADQFAQDYEVSARIDENQGEILDSSCTCPAFGRFGAICKHVIALIMQYNDAPEQFEELGNGIVSSVNGGTDRSRNVVHHTSRMLRSYMQQEDSRLEVQSKNRQLDLLKEISSRATGDVGSNVALSRHMPIGSVVLRPLLKSAAKGWYLRVHIAVPSKGISYVIKDVRGLVDAVQQREFVTYGKKLGFVHSLDSFDERSRSILTILGRAIEIRKSVSGDFEFYKSKVEAQEMRLSDDETAELLDLFVDADATLDYVPAHGDFASAVPVRVVGGDPELGLEVVRADEGNSTVGGASSLDNEPVGGDNEDAPTRHDYCIRHSCSIEQFIIGRGSSFVVVDSADGDGSLGLSVPEIHRCSRAMTANRNLLRVLCDGDEQHDLYLSSDDVEEFSRTVLPALDPIIAEDDSDNVGNVKIADADLSDNGSDREASSNGTEHSGLVQGGANKTAEVESAAEGGATPTTHRDSYRGIAVKLPPELIGMRRVPCHIETYLDRDKNGITCDVQARYGDERFHVFSGISGHERIARDHEAERLAVEAVRQYFPMPQGTIARIAEDDDKAIYRLLNEGLPVLRGLGEVFSTPSFDGLTSSPHPVFKVGLAIKSGLVEVSPIADEIDPADVPALLNSYRKKRKFHRLRSGAFVNMADVDTSRLDEVSSDLGLKSTELDSGTISVPAYESYYLDHQADEQDKSDEFRSYLNDLRVLDPKSYRIPDSLAHVLRPYQVEGFRWLNAVSDKGFGGILADEMGLGKTVQMLSYLLSRRNEQRQIGPSLIVCPASLVYNWAGECAKFAPRLNVSVLAGSKGERRAELENAKLWYRETHDGQSGKWEAPDVFITSYDLLRRDIDDYEGLECYCMTLDEAQYIKNHATKSAHAVRSISARHRFALTGTPIENRLSELWSIFDFLMPGMLGAYKHFRDRFEMPILSGDEKAQAKLQAFVGPFILRRLKSQVLKDLPDKIENVITVRLEGEQRRLYAALEQQLRATLNKQRDIEYKTGKIQILAQLTRLRQVCCDPRLLFSNVGSNVVKNDKHVWGVPSREIERADDEPIDELSETADASVNAMVDSDTGLIGLSATDIAGKPCKVTSAKLDAIEELVSSCQDAGRKMLIFSQFTSYLDLIAERLRSNGVAYNIITGSTPKRKRLELVERFNNDDTPVFLISLKAGNTGLNLTGACVVVHADPWWNAAAQEQATDRAHRIGQTQDVNVYQIVAKDTIEERILKMQRSKSDLARRFVDNAGTGTASGISDLTKDDLLKLLG
jgi:SNF2 family DNA or RNA helicase